MAFPGDLVGTHHIKRALASSAITASGTGVAIDLGEAGGETVIILNVGAVTGTSPTLDFTLTQSLNDNTASADSAADAYTSISGSEITLVAGSASTVVTLSLKGRSKRWVKLAYTAGGTTPSFTMGGVIIAAKTSY